MEMNIIIQENNASSIAAAVETTTTTTCTANRWAQPNKERPPLHEQLPQFQVLLERKNELCGDIQAIRTEIEETRRHVELEVEEVRQVHGYTERTGDDRDVHCSVGIERTIAAFNQRQEWHLWLKFAIQRAMACVHLASVTHCPGYGDHMLNIVEEAIGYTSKDEDEHIVGHYILFLEDWIGFVSYMTGMELPRVTNRLYERKFLSKSPATASEHLRFNCYVELVLNDPSIWCDMCLVNQREFLHCTSRFLQLNLELIKNKKCVSSEWRQMVFDRVVRALTRFLMYSSNRSDVISLVVRTEILLLVKSVVRQLTSYFDAKYFPSILLCCEFIYQLLYSVSVIEEEDIDERSEGKERRGNSEREEHQKQQQQQQQQQSLLQPQGEEKEKRENQRRSREQQMSERYSVIEPFRLGLTIRSFLLLLQFNQSLLLNNDKEWLETGDGQLSLRICVRMYTILHILCMLKEKPLKIVLEQTILRHLGEDQQISLPLIVYNGLLAKNDQVRMLATKLLGTLVLDIDAFAQLWSQREYALKDILMYICATEMRQIVRIDAGGRPHDDNVLDEDQLQAKCSLIQDAIFAAVALMNREQVVVLSNRGRTSSHMHDDTRVRTNGNHTDHDYDHGGNSDDDLFPMECATMFTWIYFVSDMQVFDSLTKNRQFARMSSEVFQFLQVHIPNLVGILRSLYKNLIDASVVDLAAACESLIRNKYTRNTLAWTCQTYWDDFCESRRDQFQVKHSIGGFTVSATVFKGVATTTSAPGEDAGGSRSSLSSSSSSSSLSALTSSHTTATTTTTTTATGTSIIVHSPHTAPIASATTTQ